MRRKNFSSGNNTVLIVGWTFFPIGLILLGVSGAIICGMIRNHNVFNISASIAMTLLGLLFELIGLMVLMAASKQKKHNIALYQEGRKLEAVVSGLSPDFSVRVNGRPGMSYICDAIDNQTGEWHRFCSQAGTFTLPPTEVLSIVDIYVDRNNYADYWIDMQSIRQCVDEYTEEQLDKFWNTRDDDFIDLTDPRLSAYRRHRV